VIGLLTVLLIAAPQEEDVRGPATFDDEAATTELPALDVGAYFPSGPFRTAQRMIAGGSTADGVRLIRRLLKEHPDAPERPQARYLLGIGLIRLGEYEDAARLFDELASSYPALKDDHLFFRGQALYLWGSYLAAADALSRVDPEGARGEEARRLRAWSLLQATDFEHLVRWLDAEKEKRPLETELIYVLARARHRTGDILGAYRAFREVWREDAHALAGQSLANIARLKIGERWMIDDAERRIILALEPKLKAGKDVDQVLGELERRLGKSSDRKLAAEVSYARGRYAEARRRFQTAEGHFRTAERTAPVEMVELRARIALELAHTQEWLGKEAGALDTYLMIAERFADRPEAEDALIAAAEIQVRGRKYEEAEDLCKRLLLQNPISQYRKRCLWTSGWAHFRLGSYERASEFFRSLTKMELDVELDGAARYWLARTETTLGNIEEASAEYKAITERFPLSYYSALAEEQLTESLEPARVKKTTSGAKPTEDLPTQLVQVREYTRLGLRDRARTALMTFEANTRKKGNKIAQSVYYAMAHLYEELNHPLDARRVREECSRIYPTSLGDEAFVEAAMNAHPLKFEEPIRKYANEFGIPDSLLFALIRTESGFRPTAVSAMSAYGLAQIILPTAKHVSTKLRMGKATPQRLFNPDYNVRLGAAYLKELLDHFQGSEVLALAAYNAGPAAVDAWTRRRLRSLAGLKGKGIGLQPAPDELAEEIPVEETRKYVKAVLARARSYARLYTRPLEPVAPPPPLLEVAEAAYTEPVDLPAPPRRVPNTPTGSDVLGRSYVGAGDEAALYESPLVP
jgi:soluble lytic murein transglycosylase